MSTAMRSYFRRFAEGYETGPAASVLGPILEAGASVYGGINQTLRSLYEKKILKRKKLPFPVISVGNLTWGGTGKTPFVEYLAKKIGEQRQKVLILTRGYNHDEVEQFRNNLPAAVLGVGKNRAAVALEISKKQKIDWAILDDGFQHWPVERKVDIVMINALNPFGNGKLIPSGILRESPDALAKATAVVISHANLIDPKELEALKTTIRKKSPKVLLIDSYLEPLFFYRAQKRARVSLDRLQKQRVATFSGVGSPRSFQLLLSRMHIKPVRNFEFTDHHTFTKTELEEIRQISQAGYADEVITTEKDFYRAPEMIAQMLNPLILATRLRISSGEPELMRHIYQSMGATPA